MYELLNKIDNVSSYKIFNTNIAYKDNKGLKEKSIFLNNTKVTPVGVTGFTFFQDFLYFSNWSNEVFKINIQKKSLQKLNDYQQVSEESNEKHLILKKDIENSIIIIGKNKFNIKNKWINLKSYILNNYIFSNYQDNITCRDIKTKHPLWQFNLNTTQEANQFVKFLGIWQNQLIVACNNGLILSIDIHTGQLIKQWQYIDNYFFDDEIKNKIPRAESFVFDGDYLVGALNKFIYKIDLKTSEITATNIEDELEKYNIFHIKTLNDNPVTSEYIYLTAMMRQKENDTKFSYDCLIALNKNTLKIDWHYPFENAGLGTNIPKLSGNKLYQLDNNNTLHIFEKDPAPTV